ncbi:MAG: histidinol-phosphate transaminase [Bacteroidota bacterium]
MIKLPDNVAALESYKPGKAVENIFQGKNFHKTAILSSNENNLGTSPKAIAAMKKAISNAYLYPDPSGLQLRTKLAKKHHTDINHIIIGNGSDNILANIFKAFFEPGDELVSSKGSFVAVNVMTKLHNIPYLQAPLTKHYAFDLDAIYALIGPKTKAIYLCNPNNPTGTMINYKELADFIGKISKNILIIIDEAYAEFASSLSDNFPDTTDINLPNVLTLRTFSKAFGLAGVRLGYGIGSPFIIETLLKVKLTFNPSSIAQAAGIGALDDEAFMNKTTDLNKKGLVYYQQAFDRMKLDYIKSFGNFVMVDFGTEAKAFKVFQELLDRGVFVRPLGFFQLPHCLRITVGLPEECQLLVEKLEEVLEMESV